MIQQDDEDKIADEAYRAFVEMVESADTVEDVFVYDKAEAITDELIRELLFRDKWLTRDELEKMRTDGWRYWRERNSFACQPIAFAAPGGGKKPLVHRVSKRGPKSKSRWRKGK